MSASISKPTECAKYTSLGVLFVVNLLNYMDRFTIAGVLTDIQSFYDINDAMAGILQTSFLIFFMLFSPICGYLGDRYNRKWIMTCGIAVWIGAVVASTFVPSNMFFLFLFLRGVVGIGEASYATISPTIIADLFSGTQRSNMLMLFYFAIPVGSGAGYMIGSSVAAATGMWQWGVRVTAILGAICLTLIITVVNEPERAAAEKQSGVVAKDQKATGYLDDLKALATNATYVTSTLGYTAIVFVVGTMSWWVPTAVQDKDAWQDNLNSTSQLDQTKKAQTNLIFGAVTCLAGLAGVAIGNTLSHVIRQGSGPFRTIKTDRSDAIVCALGAIIGIPTFFLATNMLTEVMAVAWVMMFICICALCFNWAINVNLMMTVVAPRRRNTANSWQILSSHLLGDASGPYVIGLITDSIRQGNHSPEVHFKALLASFYLPNALLILSAILFIIAAYLFPRDQRKFAEETGVSFTAGKSNSAFKESSVDISSAH